jgi:hypothetical protein
MDNGVLLETKTLVEFVCNYVHSGPDARMKCVKY